MDELLLGPIVGGLKPDRAFLWGRANGPGLAACLVGEKTGYERCLVGGEIAALNGGERLRRRGAGERAVSQHTLSLCAHPERPTSRHGAGALSRGSRLSRSTGCPLSFTFAFGSCFRPRTNMAGRYSMPSIASARSRISASSSLSATRSMPMPSIRTESARSPVRCRNIAMFTPTPGRDRRSARC